ncbi:MAG TPA: adenylate/guanylate cyclase domain-containing protein [Chloroflexota bacterium]|nr:adenylate/guanylate cyclase domain-containing protein [Chloroflexota bacterium]
MAPRLVRLSIRSRLLLLLLAVGLSAVAAVALVAYQSGRAALEASVINGLTSLRAARVDQVETYFRDRRARLRTLDRNPAVVDAMREFRAAAFALRGEAPAPEAEAALRAYYAELFLPALNERLPTPLALAAVWPEQPLTRLLQAQYLLATGPAASGAAVASAAELGAYTAVHARYQPFFYNLAEQLGLHDVYLIDAETLFVVYALRKEPDFAADLRDGPWRETALARLAAALAASDDLDAVAIADFTAYPPALGEPSLFLGTPLDDGRERVGILVAELSVVELDRLVTGNYQWRRDGLGATGETYLVGSDFLMRSNSRFLIEDPAGYAQRLRQRGVPERTVERIQRLGTTILEQRVDTPAVRAALAGQTATRVGPDYHGAASLASFAPLALPDLHWALIAEIDADEALAPIRALLWRIAALALVIAGALALAALWLARAFVQPIQALTCGAERVAAGQLDTRVRVTTGDELATLAEAFNHMVRAIREQQAIIEEKNRENEQLLLNILPAPVAERLKKGEDPIADAFPEVTVLFADVVGFTPMAARTPPQTLVALLDELFSAFDEAAQQLGVEKIKTIGDAYMAVGGVVGGNGSDHTRRMVELGLELLRIVARFGAEQGLDLSLRVGINSGPVVAGVIGRSKFIYDLWGDTVNIASRMESQGVPGAIQVTRPVYEALKGEYPFRARGLVEVKGKGPLETWLLDLAPQPAVGP